MNSLSSGRLAEQKAANHLSDLGYEILHTNWRTPACEIDIVASKPVKTSWWKRKQQEIYFVEVKYRKTTKFGKPLDYVTKTKLKHMERAAKIWVKQHDWDGPIHLSAIGIQGEDLEIKDFIEDIYL